MTPSPIGPFSSNFFKFKDDDDEDEDMEFVLSRKEPVSSPTLVKQGKLSATLTPVALRIAPVKELPETSVAKRASLAAMRAAGVVFSKERPSRKRYEPAIPSLSNRPVKKTKVRRSPSEVPVARRLKLKKRESSSSVERGSGVEPGGVSSVFAKALASRPLFPKKERPPALKRPQPSEKDPFFIRPKRNAKPRPLSFAFNASLGRTSVLGKACPPTPARPRRVSAGVVLKLEKKFKDVNQVLSVLARKIPGALVGRGNFCFALRVRNLDQLLGRIRDAIVDIDDLDLLERHLESHAADYVVKDQTPLSEIRVLKSFHDASSERYTPKFRKIIIGNHMASYEKERSLGIPCAKYYNDPRQDFFYIQEYLPVGLDNHPAFSGEIHACNSEMTNLSPATKSILEQCKQIVLKGFRGGHPIDASADGGNFRIRGDRVVRSDFFEVDVTEPDQPAMKMIETIRILSRGADPRNPINKTVYNFFRSEPELASRLIPYEDI